MTNSTAPLPEEKPLSAAESFIKDAGDVVRDRAVTIIAKRVLGSSADTIMGVVSLISGFGNDVVRVISPKWANDLHVLTRRRLFRIMPKHIRRLHARNTHEDKAFRENVSYLHNMLADKNVSKFKKAKYTVNLAMLAITKTMVRISKNTISSSIAGSGYIAGAHIANSITIGGIGGIVAPTVATLAGAALAITSAAVAVAGINIAVRSYAKQKTGRETLSEQFEKNLFDMVASRPNATSRFWNDFLGEKRLKAIKKLDPRKLLRSRLTNKTPRLTPT